jgi:transposase
MALDAATLPDDPTTLRAMLRAAHDEIERLRGFIAALNRNRFGARSERLDPDQLNLGLEDAEQELAASAEAVERKAGPVARTGSRRNLGNLPAHLPRIERVIDIAEKTCPCCRSELHRIGEDVAERLDVVPAQFRVIVTRRPKYACRACEGTVIQAPAPGHVVEGGLPTEALIAQVVVSKYADHCPLYRQAGIYARQGIDLDRATLADWVGRAAWFLAPVYDRLRAELMASPKLFADETTAPVLDPGRGRTKTGQLWTYARDDRPWGGTAPPAVVYVYAPDRSKARPREHLAGFRGVLQVDAYASYKALGETGAVTLALCWAHARRRFYEIAKLNDVDPLAYLTATLEALASGHPVNRIDELLPWRSAPQPSTV